MEEAVLETQVDVLVQGVTGAGNELPGHTAVVKMVVVVAKDGVIGVKLAPGEAEARADIEAQPVLVAQVEQQVGHDCRIAGGTAAIDRSTDRAAFTIGEDEIDIVDADMFVAGVEFSPD